MKKILLVISVFVSLNMKAQNLDTVSVSLQLRAQDWAWAIGKAGQGSDSVSRSRIRAIRTAIIAANPATWTTNVTINNVSGYVVMYIYNAFLSAPFGEMMAMGATNAERVTIYTNIRAINNATIQYHIGNADATGNGVFISTRQNGKTILLDN